MLWSSLFFYFCFGYPNARPDTPSVLLVHRDCVNRQESSVGHTTQTTRNTFAYRRKIYIGSYSLTCDQNRKKLFKSIAKMFITYVPVTVFIITLINLIIITFSIVQIRFQLNPLSARPDTFNFRCRYCRKEVTLNYRPLTFVSRFMSS